MNLNAIQQITTPSLSNPTIGGLINLIVGTYLFPIAGFIMLGYAVIGGYEYMFSYGDPKKTASGREKITYGIIGFIVIFSSYWMVRIVGRVLDIKAIKDIFGV